MFSGYICSGTIGWSDVIQGDGQAKTVTITETLPTVEVRVKSGSKAALVSAVFLGNFLSATVTISQGVANYAWSVCQPADTPPTVTINQAAGQADPTNARPINFDVVFSEPVTGFAATDVALAGTAGGNDVVVPGAAPAYHGRRQRDDRQRHGHRHHPGRRGPRRRPATPTPPRRAPTTR